MSSQPPIVCRRVVRGKNGRFTCAMPLRNPTGELVMPREYWDRYSPTNPQQVMAPTPWYRRLFAPA